ncbi:MAG: HAD-IA family hydrolase [Spirochaetes bacterium]|jgi:putative hydrolase of the HAD superfamily|nr:HAD-IA family hydrolase [Spirochaetota bacterium]
MTDKPCTALVFDLFHTLSSIRHTHGPGDDTAGILGVDPQEWRNALFNRSNARLKGQITDPVKIIRDVSDKINPGIPDEIIRKAAASRYSRFEKSLINPAFHVIETLKSLRQRGYKIGLVSNADVMEVAAWDKSLFSSCFDFTVFSCHCGYVKPEPSIYKLCIEGLGKTADECIFVGDGGNNEHTGAKKCGMRTIFTSEFIKDLWPERIADLKAKADYHISDIRQLLNTDFLA